VELMHRYSKMPDLPIFRHRVKDAGERASTSHPRIHRAQQRLGPEAIAQLVADYQAGRSTTELMRQHRIGKGTVLRILDGAGVTRRQ